MCYDVFSDVYSAVKIIGILDNLHCFDLSLLSPYDNGVEFLERIMLCL